VATLNRSPQGLLDFGIMDCTIGHPEGPETLSHRCVTVVVEVNAEVPLATPTMQAGQGS
jgi:hypothetical protein